MDVFKKIPLHTKQKSNYIQDNLIAVLNSECVAKFFSVRVFYRSLVFFAAIGGLAIGIGLAIAKYYSGYLPNLNQLEMIRPSLVTRVYCNRGMLVKEYFIQRRIIITLDSMPTHLIEGLIAVEDKNFRKHWGVDLVHGVLRSVVQMVFHGERHGGSTITQQLSRNLFLTHEVTIERKIKEALTAILIERTYTKDEILEFYLNQVNFGAAFGVEAASQRYFGKSAKDLTIDEAATFIGMLRAPNRYRPDFNPEQSQARRDVILTVMRNSDVITQEEFEKAISIKAHHTSVETKDEIGAYFFENIRLHVARRYGESALYTGGLSIYTTLDFEQQRYTEQQLKSQLRQFQRNMNRAFYNQYLKHRWDRVAPEHHRNIPRDSLIQYMNTLITDWANRLPGIPPEDTLVTVQGAFMAMDNHTGAINVMIGGRNFAESEFNRVFARRQPGSAFKPFIFAAGVARGFTASSILLDQPIVILSEHEEEEDWRPSNYDETFVGPVTFIEAISRSLNLSTVYLLNKVTPRAAIDMATLMGVRADYKAVPSLALGVFEVRLFDMVRAFSIFANQGNMITPHMIERIEDRDGNVLESHIKESRQVISEEVAYIMTTLLHSAVRRGTAHGIVASGFTHPSAGKTGTTNQATDTWFVGYTPYMTAGSWFGSDIQRTLGPGRTGSSTALPLWIDYMKLAHKDIPPSDFEAPSNIVYKNICSETGKLGLSGDCPRIYYGVAFIAGTQPNDSCNVHKSGSNQLETQQSDNPWGIRREQPSTGTQENQLSF